MLSKKKKRSSQKFFRRSPKKKKKRSSQKFFKRPPQKNVFQKIFQALHKILTIQRPIFEDLRPRGQGQGLDLQGQGLQNVSSRTSSRPRTSSRTPPLRYIMLRLGYHSCYVTRNDYDSLVEFIPQSNTHQTIKV